jgi:hypothetical protein
MSEILLLAPAIAVCVLVSGAVGAILHALRRPISSWLSKWPSAPSKLCATFSLLPALAGFVALAALMAPGPLAHCHCYSHGGHHLHLCPQHPFLSQSLLQPACVVLAGWLLVAGPRLVRFARQLWASALWVESLRRLPCVVVDGVIVRLREGSGLDAFTAGVFSPLIVVDRPLWDSLSDPERRAVVHHEKAHAQRWDGLSLVSLRLCNALVPWVSREQFIDTWKAASETVCDRRAATAVGDARIVARALLALERIRGAFRPVSAEAVPVLGMASAATLERRVRGLLRQTGNNKAIPRNDVLMVSAGAFGAVILTVAWPGNMFHHAVESVLGLLFR